MVEAAKENGESQIQMKPIPRMRTVPKLVQELQDIDPETCVTKSYIYRLIREDTIRAIRVGNKILLNMDDVLEYLRTGVALAVSEEPEMGGIRRLDAKLRSW